MFKLVGYAALIWTLTFWFCVFGIKKRPTITKTQNRPKIDHKLTNQFSAVWEKRQMGNVLLIIILGIKIVLAETVTQLDQLYLQKSTICWLGWPARFKIINRKKNRMFGRIGKASSKVFESRFGISVKNYPRNLFLVQKKVSRQKMVQQLARGLKIVETVFCTRNKFLG